jgi:hypothetical protein
MGATMEATLVLEAVNRSQGHRLPSRTRPVAGSNLLGGVKAGGWPIGSSSKVARSSAPCRLTAIAVTLNSQ